MAETKRIEVRHNTGAAQHHSQELPSANCIHSSSLALQLVLLSLLLSPLLHCQADLNRVGGFHSQCAAANKQLASVLPGHKHKDRTCKRCNKRLLDQLKPILDKAKEAKNAD